MTTPLSKTQYGIYVECVKHSGEICYNLPFLYTFDRDLDAEKFCKAVEAAVKAHPTLFTRIRLDDEGEPVQVIEADEDFKVSVEDISEDIAVKRESLTRHSPSP